MDTVYPGVPGVSTAENIGYSSQMQHRRSKILSIPEYLEYRLPKLVTIPEYLECRPPKILLVRYSRVPGVSTAEHTGLFRGSVEYPLTTGGHSVKKCKYAEVI